MRFRRLQTTARPMRARTRQPPPIPAAMGMIDELLELPEEALASASLGCSVVVVDDAKDVAVIGLIVDEVVLLVVVEVDVELVVVVALVVVVVPDLVVFVVVLVVVDVTDVDVVVTGLVVDVDGSGVDTDVKVEVLQRGPE